MYAPLNFKFYNSTHDEFETFEVQSVTIYSTKTSKRSSVDVSEGNQLDID